MEPVAGINNTGLTAILVGGMGLVGGLLLDKLLGDHRYDRVVTLSRKRIPKNHPKLDQYQVDLLDPGTYHKEMRGNHLFICTGTTQAKTPDPKDYYRIEHDLPVMVAQTAFKKGVDKVLAISALDADPNSSFKYNRGKGEMERDIETIGFAECYFVQPALIGGEREERRPFERIWKKLQTLADPLMIGFLKKYRIIAPEVIAKSMIIIAIDGYHKNRIESEEIKSIVAA
ncbi:MAG: NAD-dependent epimerase/dehydratase family protein [Nonlabens sp.]